MSDYSRGRGESRRGRLKIFVGAAPGVGKTYTMLRQARDLKAEGVDVVVGYYEIHNRAETRALLADLEVVPRHTVYFHGRTFEELNINAILARAPRLVVIDELAHTNVPGSRNAKRYMDVEEILGHGVDVMTAVNIQHFETVAEEAGRIIGAPVREVVPEVFLSQADELELIDVTPETIRRRLKEGLIYPPEKVPSALNHYFRYDNLSSLRELALREVAEDVDERLLESHERQKIEGPVGARENVMVCVSYPERAVRLISIGARMSERLKTDLIVFTVVNHRDSSWQTGREEPAVAACRELAEQHRARFVVEPLNDRSIGQAIMDAAHQYNVTQIVIGQPRPGSKWRRWVTGDPVSYLLHNLRFIDLRIVGWRERPKWSDPADLVDSGGTSSGPPPLDGRRS